MITAVFNGSAYARATGLWQYDYGQVLRIQGLSLTKAVKIDFSLSETGSESVPRVGVTKDGVTDVPIPDSMLENGDTTMDYDIYAFVYIEDETSGKTTHRITMPVTSRPKPQAFDAPEDAQLFRDAIAAVNESAGRAEAAEKLAEEKAGAANDAMERAQRLADQVNMNADAVNQDVIRSKEYHGTGNQVGSRSPAVRTGSQIFRDSRTGSTGRSGSCRNAGRVICKPGSRG